MKKSVDKKYPVMEDILFCKWICAQIMTLFCGTLYKCTFNFVVICNSAFISISVYIIIFTNIS